jgi:hypothetical protein
VLLGVAFVLLAVGVAKTGQAVQQWQRAPAPRQQPVPAGTGGVPPGVTSAP